MTGIPWWAAKVSALLAVELDGLGLGGLWSLSQRIRFIRENVEPKLLRLDFDADPRLEALWAQLRVREEALDAALERATLSVVERLQSGALGPERFRAEWEGLGFDQGAEGGGTAADDYLDALLQVTRLTTGDERPSFGQLNMSSRASRVADFLEVARPGPGDVVFDLGSGSGKLALTVGLSSLAKIKGVEVGHSYVAAANATAERLGLRNVEFIEADVRAVDLSRGTIFYLYYPFYGEVAGAVAQTLGTLGRAHAITVYASGPQGDFGEHFMKQVEDGALRLSERRGEHSEVMVLRST